MHLISQNKDKNYMIMSIDAGKLFDNTKHPFMIETHNRLRNRKFDS